MRALHLVPLCGLLSALVAGCPGTETAAQVNPFLTLTETFGVTAFGVEEERQRAARGELAEGEFRRDMTITFANNHPSAELNVAFAAWVNVSSIRTAEQQDALLRGGYVQLARAVDLGTVFTLPPGTFVYNGPGVAGATAVRVAAAEESGPSTQPFTIITPDVFLAFLEPPTSCDSVAFEFTIDGVVVEEFVASDIFGIFAGATNFGGRKTLSQVDAYQCEPLEPGLFLKSGGGARRPNEYFEGDAIGIDFFQTPDAAGNAARVTISSS